MPESPARRLRPWVISVAIHAVIVVAIIAATSSGESAESEGFSFYGDAEGSSGGIGRARVAPPQGRSLPADEAKDYVGLYSIANAGRPRVEMLISHVNDGESHWSLLVHEGSLTPYKLIPVAPDTFAHQMVLSRSYVFVRGDSGVVGIEMRARDQIRHAARISAR